MLSADSFPPLDADFPVFNAALGDANLRATGRVADGWLPSTAPASALEEMYEVVTTVARDRDRDPSDVTVSPIFPTAVSESAERARNAVRSHVAFYVGSADRYKRAVARAYPDEADTIRQRWEDGDRDDAREAITDEMIDDIAIAGTPDQARERLRDRFDLEFVDRVLLLHPDGVDAIIETTVEALAPDKL